MPPGFDQPTTNSASRPVNVTGPRESTHRPRRVRRAQHEEATAPAVSIEPSQPQTIAARRRSQQQPVLPLPEAASDLQQLPPRPKTPVYLQGKNPYGQVLQSIDHPYREPEAAIPITPSQSTAGLKEKYDFDLHFVLQEQGAEAGEHIVRARGP